MTFNEWLIMEHGQGWQGINMDLIVEGYTEKERYDYHYELSEEYQEYCDENDIEAEY